MSAGNDRRFQGRQRFRLATVICLVVGSVSVRAEAPGTRPSASTIAAQVVNLTNVERARRGHVRLRANARLTRAAQIHAEQMARARQAAHVLRNANYPQAEDRLAAAGYQWEWCGENVASGQSSAAAAMDDWMHSHGHRENILNPHFTEMGAGYARDRAGRPYYVQVFGSPSS